MRVAYRELLKIFKAMLVCCTASQSMSAMIVHKAGSTATALHGILISGNKYDVEFQRGSGYGTIL